MINSSHDTSIHFEEYIESIDSLPSEIHQHCRELREKDEQYQKIREQISHHYASIHRFEKNHGFLTPNPNESTIIGNVRKEMQETKSLANEKVEISEKTLKLISLHIKRLNETLSRIQNLTNTASKANQNLSNSKHEEKNKSNDNSTKAVKDQVLHSVLPMRNRKGSSITKSSISRKKKKIENTELSNQSTASSTDTSAKVNANNEPLYCICRQISYGNMIACDNQKNCPHEWFHYECVGLVEPPKGSWYCPDCRVKVEKNLFSDSEEDVVN